MARAGLNNTLADLETVVASMRSNGVTSWAGSPVGDLVLGAPVPPKPRAEKGQDQKANRRTYYTEILGWVPTDDLLEKLP
jgi:hypothetical protein